MNLFSICPKCGSDTEVVSIPVGNRRKTWRICRDCGHSRRTESSVTIAAFLFSVMAGMMTVALLWTFLTTVLGLWPIGGK